MLNTSQISSCAFCVLALIAILPGSARAESSNNQASKSVSYSGKFGSVSAGYSATPYVNTNGNTVEYGSSYNTYTNVNLAGPNGGSVTGSGSGSGSISASSGTGSGSNSSSYLLTSGNGATVNVQNSGTTSIANGSQTYSGSGSAAGSTGNTYSWSSSVSHSDGSKPSGTLVVNKNGNTIKTVTF